MIDEKTNFDRFLERKLRDSEFRSRVSRLLSRPGTSHCN